MSKVVVLIHGLGPQRAEAVKAIREKLGLSLSDVTQACSTGIPLLERRLFDQGDPDFPARLLELVSQLDALGASYSVFELLDNQIFSCAEKYYEINYERLRAMIEAREESLVRQRFSGETDDV